MRRPIVGLYSNYNYNYTFGSSVVKMIIDENQLSCIYHVIYMKPRRILHKMVCLYVLNKAYFSFVKKGKYLGF
jgi:hypothetical protein